MRAEPGSPGHPAGAHVLIVDDDVATVAELARVLAADGHLIVSAAMDARSAVARYRELRPDLVLLDLHLGPDDGLEVLERLAIPADAFVPVVVMSSAPGAGARQEALRAGASTFLTKPFDGAELRLRVENLLHLRRMHLRLTTQNAELESRLHQQGVDHEAQHRARRVRSDRVVGLIEDHAIAMRYQPIVDLAAGRVVAVEALAAFPGRPSARPTSRWFDEAVELGLGPQLEVAAITAAMDGLSVLPEGVSMAFNCSSASAISPLVLDALTSLPGDRLVLELGQRAVAGSFDDLRAALAAIRARGVRLALDDTDSGFANLSRMLKLRPDIIKVNRALVQGIAGDPVRRALASSMVGFAEEIGASVVAEGIETVEELDTVRRIGITLGQGYLLGRPTALPLRTLDMVVGDDGAEVEPAAAPVGRRRRTGTTAPAPTEWAGDGPAPGPGTDAAATVDAAPAAAEAPGADPTDQEVPAGSLVVDAGGWVVEASPAVRSVLGHRAGDLVGRRLAAILHADDAVALTASLDRLAAGGNGSTTAVVRIPWPAGERLAVLSLTPRRRDGATEVVVVPRTLGTSGAAPADIVSEATARTTDAVALLVANVEGGHEIVSVNAAFTELTGYRPADVLGRNVVVLAGERTEPEVFDALVASLRGAGQARHTLVLHRGDGQSFTAEATVVPTPDACGTWHSVLVLRDVSAERASLEALEERVEWLTSQFDAAGLGVALIGPDGRVLEANPTMGTLLGCDEGELQGTHFTALTHPEDVATDWRTFWSVMDGATDRAEGEYRLARRDGGLLWVKATRSILSTAEGARRYVISLVEDVSERRQAVEELRLSEQRYRAVIDGISHVVFQIDAEGRWTFLSQAWEGLTAATVAESLGGSFVDLVHPDDRGAAEAAVAGLLAGGGEVTGALLRYVGNGGGVRLVAVRGSALVDGDGRVVGGLGILEDVTEQHQQEVELRHAQKLESVGRLAAGIAHEINTPIQFIGDNLHFLADSFATILAGGGDGVSGTDAAEELAYLAQEVPEAIQQSRDGAERVATIVRAMKAFGHPDRAEQSATDLNEAIRNTVIVARNEHKYVADVVTELGALPPVTCHSGDLSQVFLNLLVNAVHAIEDAGRPDVRGTITIRTWVEGGEVAVAVTDDGAGMSEDVRARIFDPFFTTKDVGRGTGQGLALARSVVVDRHGGRIEVRSVLGEGTTFVLWLPVDGCRTVAAAP